ncbi:EamA family transporter [Sphingomonas sp. ASV193]|uniref:DMT family transporter n=1 Tax=Sphingomonas sp. ASV193 TaxID=3144405 RepID=UPI0032E88857
MSDDGRDHPFDRSIAIPFAIFTLIWGSTWLVIKDGLGTVAPQWSVAYRFLLAGGGMALVARWKGQSLKPTRKLLDAAVPIALLQFSGNFNAVYLAEQHITSGLVATVFALLMVPNSLLAWAVLGHRPTPRFLAASAVAASGVALLFLHEWREAGVEDAGAVAAGIAWTLIGMTAASGANVWQATKRVRKQPLLAMLAWAMGVGALIDVVIALSVAGLPTLDPRPQYWAGVAYLALAASVLCFSLYYPVVRKIGPGRAAYSSALVPVIAMALSTLFENYRWTPLAASGAALAIAGLFLALWQRRPEPIAAPDAG